MAGICVAIPDGSMEDLISLMFELARIDLYSDCPRTKNYTTNCPEISLVKKRRPPDIAFLLATSHLHLERDPINIAIASEDWLKESKAATSHFHTLLKQMEEIQKRLTADDRREFQSFCSEVLDLWPRPDLLYLNQWWRVKEDQWVHEFWRNSPPKNLGEVRSKWRQYDREQIGLFDNRADNMRPAVIDESWYDRPPLLRIPYSRSLGPPVRIVVYVVEETPYKSLQDLLWGEVTVATEFPWLARQCLIECGTRFNRLTKHGKRLKLEKYELSMGYAIDLRIRIYQSYGNTELKVRDGLAKAGFDIVDTGDSINENRLKIIHQALESALVIVANGVTDKSLKLRRKINWFVSKMSESLRRIQDDPSLLKRYIERKKQ